MSQLQAAVSSHIEADALAPGFRGIFSLGGRVLDAVKKLKASVTATEKEKLKTAALAAYDVAASAIDIPFLPDAQERSLETWLRELLAAQIDRLLAE
jgi:hypothetical protein